MDMAGGSSRTADNPTSHAGASILANQEKSFFSDVPRQIYALLIKNYILCYRNRTATFLRIFSSLFFILLIFLVNEGIKARYGIESVFKDLKTPPRKVIEGIPACVRKAGSPFCITFAYAPAPNASDGFRPGEDFSDLKNFAEKVGCPIQFCSEMYRVHKIVRTIMSKNSIDGKPQKIPAESVLGFATETALDEYLYKYPERVQGGYVFASPSDSATTFVIQMNNTVTQIRKVWERPFLNIALQMQVAASRAIANLKNADLNLELGIKEYAHPPFEIINFEGIIAPLFLIGCAMFPFVIQMNEIVTERELKLRKALEAMGLHDTSYWISWHLFQTTMTLLFGFFIWLFGLIFQFALFKKNDFGIVFLTFWLFGQSMVGLAFFIGSLLSRGAQSVSVGFAVFLVGFVLYFMISLAGFPYGNASTIPFSYESNRTSGNLTLKTSRSDRGWEPGLAFLPPTLLIKAIGDMGIKTATDTSNGIRFSEAYSYCTIDSSCNPEFSIGRIWGWFIGLYILYSFLGLYLENVLADAMGVKKPFYYFLLPSYWGFGVASIIDAVDDRFKESTDEDVIQEEVAAQQRQNTAMGIASAIEIRGLRATFTRGGKEFHAVRCPWYCIGKKQLFALLGPNGAGKTTTINMLTGFLPPSGGNALVFGETVAHSSGMGKIRRLMGVCPQFDILWDNLSAKEHLVLFATIKGIKSDSVSSEADRRIEEVRLQESARQVAGAFSGGMKRRLSVAVSLVGNPEVVYLDEPTTGMDPINRRHVWDVIEAAKKDRCVILTTHSMEEADILGDKIGIMAKGRLRCIGNSVHLKTKFGEGYRVSVSCGDNLKPDDPRSISVKSLFKDRLGVSVAEESKAYMHFNVPSGSDSDAVMSNFFEDIEAQKGKLGIVDVQLAMSSLEDVFLTVATASELEEARNNNKTTIVTLKSGEPVGVLLGSPEMKTSPQGVYFTVTWGTDENGNLIPTDTVEYEMVQREMLVMCPHNTGREAQINVEGSLVTVVIPDGVLPGQQFQANVSVPVKRGDSLVHDPSTLQPEMTNNDVRARVEKLRTPFAGQANALFRKNLMFQYKRTCSNCCLVCVPIFVLALVFGIQVLVELVFLGTGSVRCPYCGPATDDFGKLYCNKASSCLDYFGFTNSSRQDLQDIFKEDVVAKCEAIAGLGPLKDKDPLYCFGNNNISCFQPQWADGGQFAFCPFRPGSIPSQPVLGYATLAAVRAETPVLYTSEASSKDLSTKVMRKSSAPSIKEKVSGAMREMTRQFFTAFTALPMIGCGIEPTAQSEDIKQAMCKLIQHGYGTEDVCCVDLTGIVSYNSTYISHHGFENWREGSFLGELRLGKNYWTDMPQNHNDLIYDQYMTNCTGSGNGRGLCNQNLMTEWQNVALPAGAYGVRYGSGKGKHLTEWLLSHALLGQGIPSQTNRMITSGFRQLMPGAESFTCTKPYYPADSAKKLPDNKCINMHEGLAILAQTAKFSSSIHPSDESGPVPECSAQQNCKFFGIDHPQIGSFQADTHGRWAQVCDFYLVDFTTRISDFQEECDAEKQCDRCSCPIADENLRRYMQSIPCACRWLYFSQSIVTTQLFSPGVAGTFFYQFPKEYNCPLKSDGKRDCSPAPSAPVSAALRKSKCWRNHFHPFSMASELSYVTPVFPQGSFFQENAINPDTGSWWNRPHVLTKAKKIQFDKDRANDDPKKTCETDRNCWIEAGFFSNGNFSFLAIDCADLKEQTCFLQRMGNISGLDVGCVSTNPGFLDNSAAVNKALYDGHYNKYSSGQQNLKEYIGAYDFHDSTYMKLNVSVIFNDTTLGDGLNGPPPRMIRLAQPINNIINAFLNVDASTASVASLMGIKEMPKIATFLSLDFGSIIGPFFFTLAFNLLFPTIVVSLVYEKEMKLRVMMRMMGLGSSAYWAINYTFWIIMYTMFTFIFIILGSNIALPSGYKLGLFYRQDASVHFVFFGLFINHTISFAFLWSTLLRAARTANISATLWVIGMAVIAYTAWDGGNFFNSSVISNDAKNVITIFPIWGFYRGWSEYNEFAFQAARLGTKGMQWSDIRNDPLCAMGTVMGIMAIEWPIFLLIALYLDQVLDSGHRVPRHPLFFLNYKSSQVDVFDQEESAGQSAFEDVQKEEGRMHDLILGPRDNNEAVMIKKINKVYPPYMGNPAKIAVKTLTMGVPHGCCFGMLGPNGAGKTTTINMLVGFTEPTSGTAEIEGFDIRYDMDRIYSLMGVCPQHDILWETLTARQHMLFYGRLKNLSAADLNTAINEGLKQVNLLHVANVACGTFSGGMKRRLSVAIAMIGNPLVCYLDEPSTGLDPASRRTLWTCIKEAKKSRAIFLTTHSMEEAEGLCDRLGIFVDGALRCIGNPKELTARFGGFYILTITNEVGNENQVSEMVHSIAKEARITYSISGTQKFEIASDQVTLAQVFRLMTENKERLRIRDWGIANTTLEEAFIKIARGAIGT